MDRYLLLAPYLRLRGQHHAVTRGTKVDADLLGVKRAQEGDRISSSPFGGLWTCDDTRTIFLVP